MNGNAKIVVVYLSKMIMVYFGMKMKKIWMSKTNKYKFVI